MALKKKKTKGNRKNSPDISHVKGNVNIIYRYGENETPPIRCIPVHPGAFAGREDYLTKIESAFRKNDTASITQTVKGLGGVGKSMLAREYALRYGKANPKATVYWFEAEDSDKIEKSVNCFLNAARWTQTRPGMLLSEELQGWYASHSGFLLVFDTT